MKVDNTFLTFILTLINTIILHIADYGCNFAPWNNSVSFNALNLFIMEQNFNYKVCVCERGCLYPFKVFGLVNLFCLRTYQKMFSNYSVFVVRL